MKIAITMNDESGEFFVSEEAGELGSIASFPYCNEAAEHVREILRRWDDLWVTNLRAKQQQDVRQVRIIHNGVTSLHTIPGGEVLHHFSGAVIDYNGFVHREPHDAEIRFDINKDAFVIEDHWRLAGAWAEESAPVDPAAFTLLDRAFAAQKEREAKEIEEIPPIVLGVDPNKKW